jgi:signal peptidase I
MESNQETPLTNSGEERPGGTESATSSQPSVPEQGALATPSSRADRHQNLHDIISIIVVLFSALVLAFGLISFVFQSYQVDGPSMQNTLHNADHLIVWKVPRTWARITGHAYAPKRGDIIVFNEPGLSAYGQSQDKQLIKRVIGLPGDRVVVKNGAITIYNKAHPKGFDPDRTLPYHNTVYTAGNIDLTLKSNQLFVCGDNRGDSLDSRVFGPIDINNVVGKLVLRVLPLNNAEWF